MTRFRFRASFGLTPLLCLLLCGALLLSPSASALRGGDQHGSQARPEGHPTKGAPGQNLPNLDDVKRRGPAHTQAQPPVPSKLRKYRHGGPGRGDSGVATGQRADASTAAPAVPTQAGVAAPSPSRDYSIVGALAAGAYNPYAGVQLASATSGIPEPPARGASSQPASSKVAPSQSSSSGGWLSSLAGLFGFGSLVRRSLAGVFENADCNVVSGWAWDSAQPGKPIIVTLFDGSQPVASVLADQYRADIIPTTQDDGRHGFSMPLPDSLRDGNSHTLSVQVQGTGFTLGTKAISSCAVAYAGAIDSADCNQVTGWAWDSNRPSAPIDVDVYVDNVFRARESADIYDATLGKGDNRHRFRLTTPDAARDGAPHSITVHPAGSAQALGTAASVTCNGPWYEGYLQYTDCNVITGWLADRNRLNTPVSVDIYAGQTLVTRVVADAYRQDVANYIYDNGRHGFVVPVPEWLRDGVSHQLTAVATGSSYNLVLQTGPITCSGQSSCSSSQVLASTEFVKDFYLGALARQPRPLEIQYWNDALRNAAAQGQAQLFAEAKLLGRELFLEGEYTNRGRMTAGQESNFVSDLYWSYLQRGPDASGQGFWVGNIQNDNSHGQNGWLNALSAFESSGEFATRVASVCPSPADSVKNYDAVTDFSPLQNSDGAWSYGYRASGGAFTPYASRANMFGAGADTWSRDGASCPMITRNNTGSTLTYVGVVVQPPDLLNVHPGPNGERSVVRWTAPAAGTYLFTGRFQGLDTTGTTTDVLVTHNGTGVFSAGVNGYGSTAPFSLTRTAAAGDTLEFSVGYGSNGTYYDDSTGLAMTVSQPSSAQTQPYNGTAGQVPGKVEAELFDAGGEGVAYHDTTPGTHGQDYDNPPNYPPPTFRQPTDVDIYKSVGYSNGYLVVMQAGDWMNYTVDVQQFGSYTVSAQTYYWGAPGGRFHVEADGVDVTGPLQLPGGSGWQTVTKGSIVLDAGRHVLRVVCDANGSDGYYMGDIDYLNFTADSNSGLVAEWKFDEGAGATASDSTGNGNTGTLQGGASWTSGVGAGALNFDGVDDYVGVASTSSITSVADNFTVSFWARPRSPHEIDPEGATGTYGVTGQRYAIAPIYRAPSEAGVGVSMGTNGVSVYEHTTNDMPAVLVYQGVFSDWTHVALVYQNKQPSLYINGQLVRTGVTSSRSAVRINPYRIGGMEYGNFDGLMDDVRVYNRPLSSGEVGALAASGGADPTGNNFSEARKDPANETGSGGDDPLSRNFNFTIPLAGLKGRAGLDAGLSLSYNSLVWTKDAATGVVRFDADDGDPSPGFRLGMPVIQRKYRNARGEEAYMMVTSSGAHVEFRQVGTTNTYEALDSSYAQLTEESGGLTLRPADGSRLSYSPLGLEYKCAKVEDRNGNYVTLTYNASGDLGTITDTLGRVLTITYDANGRPIDVEQTRSGQAHQWATFGYTNITITAGFDMSHVTVLGPANGTVLSVLTQVSLDDGSRYNFLYNSWGQVYRTESHAADGRLLTYTEYDLQTPTSSQTNSGTDCPRFTQRKDFAKDWNNDAPVVTTYSVGTAGEQDVKNNQTLSGTVGVDTPATVMQKVFYGAANTFKRGLVTSVETWAQSTPNQYGLVRTAQTTWTQDDETLTYQLNPRVAVSEIFDPQNNHTGTTYSYTSFGLPTDATEWSGTSSGVLRRTHTEYDLDPAYVNLRILGLVSSESVYDDQGHVASKVSYTYDQGGEFLQGQGEPVQHDGANYGPTFVMGRGLVTSVRRWDVTALQDVTKSVESRVGYNTIGSPIFSRDPLGHQSTISYSDRFSDKTGTNTLAYPTMATDADGFSSKVEYGFDTGLVSRSEDPKGAQQTFTYDAAGRTLRVERSGRDTTTNQSVSGGYVRWVYSDAMDAVQSWTQVDAGKPEVCSISIVDGAGRTRATASDFPGSTGGYKAQYKTYDIAGRVSATSNPAEMNGLWTPAGDDAAGWNLTNQTYDWKGRPLLITNADNTTKEFLYGGCGCAGGEVVTTRDEVGHRQRITYDALGRVQKSQVLTQQLTKPQPFTADPNEAAYSTVTNTYDALDHITQVRQRAEASGVEQVATKTYDGHGRVASEQSPEQTAATTYLYYNDDTIQQIRDARGATTTFTYNGRRLGRTVTFGTNGVAEPTTNLEFQYDADGNRLWMTDGAGRVDYQYDALSRLTSETRYFSIPNRSYTIGYGYNLAGQLSSVTDPFGSSFSYQRDTAGQLTAVTGSPYAGVTSYVSNVKYRAWGAVKSASYGNNSVSTTQYNSRLQPFQFRLTDATSGASLMREDYSYYADGRLSLLTDLDDASGNNPPSSLRFLSRTYSYDLAGRVTDSRGTHGAALPLIQSYNYDEFDNLTNRSGSYYDANGSLTQTDTAHFTNNKRDGWTYDADGRFASNPATSNAYARHAYYDAAGRQVKTVEDHPAPPNGAASSLTDTITYDGDGQVVYETTYNSLGTGSSTSSYTLRSTALGGEVLTMLTSSGDKSTTFVPAMGLLFAHQATNPAPAGNSVAWTQRDPVGVSETGKGIYDPLGNYIPFQQPTDPRPPAGSYNSSSMAGIGGLLSDPNNYGLGCMLQGIPTRCSTVMRLLGNGSAAGGVISGTANPLVELAGMGLIFTTTQYTGAAKFYYNKNGSLAEIYISRVVEGQGIGLSPAEKEEWYRPLNIIVFGLTIAPGRQMGIEQNQQPPNKDQRLKDAKELAKEQLRTHPECAKLLGKDNDPKKALEKALKALDKVRIGFAPLGGPQQMFKDGTLFYNSPDAQIDPKTKVITINTQGRFMINDGVLPVVNEPDRVMLMSFDDFNLSDTETAALILLHELGHIQNVLEDDSNKVPDQDGAEERNNRKIYDDCFKELKQSQ